MESGSVLLVQSPPERALALCEELQALGLDVEAAQTLHSARERLKSLGRDVLLLGESVGALERDALAAELRNTQADACPTLLALAGDAPAPDGSLDASMPADLPLPLAARFVALHARNRRLRQRLSQAERGQAASQRQLDHLMHVKKQFLSILTHDLRAPITSMKLATEILGDQLDRLGDTDPDGRMQRFVEMVGNGIHKVESNFNEIMAVANLDLYGLELAAETLPVDACFRPAIASAGDALPDRATLNAGIEAEGPLQGDPYRLRQMLGSMLSTAVGRTNIDGEVRTTIRDHDGGLLVEVEDEGLPLHPDDMAEILRGLEKDLPTGRTRVGLYIASHIARAHQGRFWLARAQSGGLRQLAWLPRGDLVVSS